MPPHGSVKFSLSVRDIEALLIERGVVVTYETIRCGCDEFGAAFAQCVKAAARVNNRAGNSHQPTRTEPWQGLQGDFLISGDGHF